MRCPCGWRIWNFKPLHRFEPHCNSVLNHGIFGYSIVPPAWNQAYVDWWHRRHNLDIDPESLVFSTAWCRQSPAWYENSPQQTKTCLSKLRSTTFSSIRLSIMDAACLNHRWNTTVPDITPSTGPIWNPSWPIRKPR